MLKYDIINALAERFDLSCYLEICTLSTGLHFGSVNAGRLKLRHRLMYRCPEQVHDGMEITFRTEAETSHDLIRAIDRLLPAEERYDLIFVDPWHTYEASAGDLYGALCLLQPNGIIVVHDCNPTDAATVGREFQGGDWCGVTYQAFIDFALATRPTSSCVVDSDYGCGVLMFGDAFVTTPVRRPKISPRTQFDWSIARRQDDAAYAFFDRNRPALLNLMSVEAFAQACGIEGDDHSTINLLHNESWTDGSAGWSVAGDVAFISTPGVAGASLAVANAAPGREVDALSAAAADVPDNRAYRASIPVEAGYTYEAQLYAVAREGTLQLLLLFVDENGAVLASPRTSLTTAQGQTDVDGWSKLAVRSVAPISACFATILIRLTNERTVASPMSALIKCAMLTQAPPAEGLELAWKPAAPTLRPGAR